MQAAYAASHYALWHQKAGTVETPDIGNERTLWGCRLEEVIAQAVAEEYGWRVRAGDFFTDPTTPGMSATLDFIAETDAPPIEGATGPGVLETKNVDWLIHRRAWTNDEPPLPILLQLQHQLACTGFQWGAVACLVGGNRLEVYPYAARPKLIADIRRRVTAFWRSIEENRPPPADGSEAAAAVLRELYPEPIDDAADMRGRNEWPEIVAEFIAAGARKKEAEAAYDAARNRLAEIMAGHKRAWGAGYSVSTAISPAKPDRPAMPGEIIKGRGESRRYIAKETVQ